MTRLPDNPVARFLRMSLVMIAAIAALGVAPSQARAEADDDNDTPTAWVYYANVTWSTVTSTVSNGYRLVDIEVHPGTTQRYSFSAVRNTGAYAKAWWYYVGVDASALSGYLSANNARLIDLEPYIVNGQTRFAAIMIRNTGSDAAGWWWLYGVTASQINDFVAANPARIIDIERYIVNGSTRFSCVMIQNTGGNAKSWWYYYNVTPSYISSRLSANNARLIDIEPAASNGTTFDVVMQRNEGQHWWWYYGLSFGDLQKAIAQNGARLIDIERYGSGYAVSMINNSNALTTRIGDILRGGTNGCSGAYLKQVNGPVLASLQANAVFEPASMIKVLHHYHAIDQVDQGADTLAGSNFLFASGGPNVCPDNTNLVVEPLSVTLNRMMENSDNPRTNAVRNMFGEANINATAAALGMSSTQLNHTIGCAGGADGAIAQPNRFTLADAGRLYESVANGAFSAANTQAFYQLMLDDSEEGLGGFNDIIDEEAAAIGLSNDKRESFRDAMRYARKGGSYTLNYDGQTHEHRTNGGWVSLTLRAGCQSYQRQYVFGTFVNDATNGANAGSAAGEAFAELMREQIRAAMQTWNSCFVDWNADLVVNSVDLLGYLQAWFSGDPSADLVRRGDIGVSSIDLLHYLDEWFQQS